MFTEEELQLGNHSFCNNVTDSLKANAELVVESVNRGLEQVICMYTFKAKEDRCDCRPLCSETTYETTVITASNWPQLSKQLSFYEQYLQNFSDISVYKDIAQAKASGNQSSELILERFRRLTLIEENFLQIFVKFDQRVINRVTEVPAINWETLASNLGGSLNLWLGISVPTVAEIIELIHSMVMIWWKRKNANRPDDESRMLQSVVD